MYGDCISFADHPYGTLFFFVFVFIIFYVVSKLPGPLNFNK